MLYFEITSTHLHDPYSMACMVFLFYNSNDFSICLDKAVNVITKYGNGNADKM